MKCPNCQFENREGVKFCDWKYIFAGSQRRGADGQMAHRQAGGLRWSIGCRWHRFDFRSQTGGGILFNGLDPQSGLSARFSGHRTDPKTICRGVFCDPGTQKAQTGRCPRRHIGIPTGNDRRKNINWPWSIIQCAVPQN